MQKKLLPKRKYFVLKNFDFLRNKTLSLEVIETAFVKTTILRYNIFIMNILDCTLILVLSMAFFTGIVAVLESKAHDRKMKQLHDIWSFFRKYVSVIGINTIADSVAAACRHILGLLFASQTPDEFVDLYYNANLSFANAQPTDGSVVIAQKIVSALNNHLRLQLPEDHREKLDQFLSNDASSQAMRENMRSFMKTRVFI